MPTKLYCFDTSSLIRAAHEAYPEDVAPSFWQQLDTAIENGVVISSTEVLRETKARSDALHAWLKRRESCFVEIDEALQLAVSRVLAAYPFLAKNRKGASAADPWVIALADIRGAIVVSEESPADSKRVPKIPGVCAELGVPCVNLLGFMRAERWRL